MQNDDFLLPPISGEGDQVPFKELVPEQQEIRKEMETEKALKDRLKKNKLILFLLLMFLVIALGLLSYLLITTLSSQPKEKVFTPSPIPKVASPTPVATTSGELIKRVRYRREALEESIRNLDLHETEITFPSLDFQIKF